MRKTASSVMALTFIALLAGCAGGASQESSPDGETEPTAKPSAAEVPCVVGAWSLDVADYSAQSEAFVLSLSIPVTGFAMTGSGAITFTQDSLVATEIDLVTTGTLVAGDIMVPMNTRSAYAGSGDWNASETPGNISLKNWANVRTEDVEPDESAPDLPAIDYTDIDSVMMTCTADTLTLHGEGAPLTSTWHR